MPPARRSARGQAACLAGGLLGTLLAGCTGDGGAVREPGAAVTGAEAEVLALLLQRNYQRGGADFVVTAPYGDEVVLTLTGEVDFRRSVGRAQLVTSHGDGRPDDTATLYFSDEELWIGDLPGLADAVQAAGADATFVRRPLATDGTADLVDVLVRTVLHLSRARADDPRAYTDGSWTWQGQRSIDSRLSAVFAGEDGPSVAVDAADDLLLQYASPLPGQSFEVTVTLADHRPAQVALPGAAEVVDVGAHPGLDAAVAF